MLSFLSPDAQHAVPEWWTGGLQAGHAVELEVYGDQMTGRLLDATGDTIRIAIPADQQVSGLRLSTAHGTAVVSLASGAARVPVACWASGDTVRLQMIGPVDFVQRRVHPRLTISLPVSLGWLQADGRTWNRALSDTVDLSLGGMRLAPATTVWPGAGVLVRVLLELPDGACQVQAAVVGTTEDYGLRLKFTDVPEAAARRIQKLTA